MPFLAFILLLFCFLKFFYYGIYEFKQKQNKPGGIASCFLALLRTYLSYNDYCCILYLLIK